jgi:N-succinyldiaminopimelate aminotransferase
VGWLIAPPALRHAVQQVHQFVTFSTATPLQLAIVQALALPDGYFVELVARYTERRDGLVAVLNEVGLNARAPEGTYFALADIGALRGTDDVVLCRTLTRDVGVAAIPLSAFYQAPDSEQCKQFIRFAFCKTDEMLEEAARRLRQGRRSIIHPE